MSKDIEWHRVGNIDLLLPGEVKEVTIAHTTICLARTREGEYGAICNSCLHQNGPLGEGYINDDGYVVCPWHGWEFHPVTGDGPPDYGDENVCSFDVEQRQDGIYVGLEPEILFPVILRTIC